MGTLKRAPHILTTILVIAVISSQTPFMAAEPDGQYYLRGICPDRAEYCGTGYDIGIINESGPIEYGERNCACWIQFNFQPRDRFPAEESIEIREIYYHIWWRADSRAAVLGYDSTGSTSSGMDEWFDVNTGSSKSRVDSYFLSVVNQNVAPEFGLYTGETISNFSIKLFAMGNNPSIVSTPNNPSFIIINPRPPEELRVMDTDRDGLSDYDEMYLIFTDPGRSDTDGDGYCDLQESFLVHAMNPVNTQDPPVFGRPKLNALHSEQQDAGFGSAVTLLGDWDGDGEGDIAVGEPGINRIRVITQDLDPVLSIDSGLTGAGFGKSIVEITHIGGESYGVVVGAPDYDNNRGRICLYDTRGIQINAISGPIPDLSFGASLCELPDRNNDGVNDLAVSAPGRIESSVPGEVYFYSGQDLEFLEYFRGSLPGDCFGYAMAVFPDGGDADDISELLVGAPGYSGNENFAGAMHLLSSSGNLMHTWYGETLRMSLGISIRLMDDLNADGSPEIAVSAPFTNMMIPPDKSSFSQCGRILVYSGKSYECLRVLSAETPGDYLGRGMAVIDDVDGDGYQDIVATTWRHRYRKSSVVILTSTNKLVWRYALGKSKEMTGEILVAVNDRTGDGLPEFILGSQNYTVIPGIENSGSIFKLTHDTGIHSSYLNESGFDPSQFFHDPDGDTLTIEKVIVSETNHSERFLYLATDPHGGSCASNIINMVKSDLPATPTPGPTGVHLLMPSTRYSTGDAFYLTAVLHNAGPSRNDVMLVVILDTGGDFYFWNTWSETPAGNLIDLPSGSTEIPVIAPFIWPDTGSFSRTGLIFWAAMIDSDGSGILGGAEGVTHMEFGFGP